MNKTDFDILSSSSIGGVPFVVFDKKAQKWVPNLAIFDLPDTPEYRKELEEAEALFASIVSKSSQSNFE